MSRHPGLAASGAAGAIAIGGAKYGLALRAACRASPNAPAFGHTAGGRQRPAIHCAPPGFRTCRRRSEPRARCCATRLCRHRTFSPAGPHWTNTTFRGRFAANRAGRSTSGGNWDRLNRNRVLGWYGRTFWPYAYYDMFDYSFWPYAYDTFWPYAYDDLYGGMFGPYASVTRPGIPPMARAASRQPAAGRQRDNGHDRAWRRSAPNARPL